MEGIPRLMAMLTYGCGLRISECLNLRVKDLDLDRGMVIVRSGKGILWVSSVRWIVPDHFLFPGAGHPGAPQFPTITTEQTKRRRRPAFC